tara:strand:+ start:158 stop:1192 length:1035 start_codon:yes stop_codon:yes gene_type:complete
MSNTCKFIDFNDSQNSCKHKCKYGEYCYKHRREYLIVNDTICRDRFTGLSKDYLKKDLIDYMKHKMRIKPILSDKQLLFNEVIKHINAINEYHCIDNDKNIVKIQSLVRGRNIRKKLNELKCNNDEDFYTYEELKDIPKKYFYSYVDDKKFRWGFDIRSLDKLLTMNYPNPYTTEPIPQIIVVEVKDKINLLKNESGYEDLTDSIVRERKDAIKQKIVDLFSYIEQSGYTCQIDWFTSLTVRRLKELYRQLEDIWNYRSQLSQQMKCNICPPNAEIFNTPMIEVMNYSCKEDLQELILHETMKFTNAISDSDRKLGFMYFLIAFGMVSPQCYHAHIDWLSFMMA